MEQARAPASVAAGHPATAAAAFEVLCDGGNAADAAVAGVLASCVAETLMTGLAGGGHAIYWDAADGRGFLVDCFVAVPGLGSDGRRGAWREVDVAFGSQQVVPYAIGAGTCGVPGVPAGCELLWRRWGQLPWERVVEPALALARAGVMMPETHATCLVMLEPVMTLDEGARIYAPDGRLLRGGERLHQPGLVATLEAVRDEGAATFYRGTLAEALLAMMRDRDGRVTRADLEAYRARCSSPPPEAAFEGRRVLARRDLSGLLAALERLPPLRGQTPGERALALAEALAPAPPPPGPPASSAPGTRASSPREHTTSVAALDVDGNACAVVTSLGLGTGDWLPGFDVHLNSMLGETDLVRDGVQPGDRMASNIVPAVVIDRDGLEFVVGGAGGTRIRSATVQALAAVLADDAPPLVAVDRPRLHPLLEKVHAEPGHPDATLEALETAGWDVVRWESRHHYFGGVNLAGRAGAAGDPRRDGAALTR